MKSRFQNLIGVSAVIVGLSILVYTSQGFSAPKSAACQNIIEELQMMRKAQNQIITSLAQNHEMFATQLSDLSFELALYKKTVPQKALISMEKSAQAYRGRSVKAMDTADQLDESTSELIKRVQRCLK